MAVLYNDDNATTAFYCWDTTSIVLATRRATALTLEGGERFSSQTDGPYDLFHDRRHRIGRRSNEMDVGVNDVEGKHESIRTMQQLLGELGDDGLRLK